MQHSKVDPQSKLLTGGSPSPVMSRRVAREKNRKGPFSKSTFLPVVPGCGSPTGMAQINHFRDR